MQIPILSTRINLSTINHWIYFDVYMFIHDNTNSRTEGCIIRYQHVLSPTIELQRCYATVLCTDIIHVHHVAGAGGGGGVNAKTFSFTFKINLNLLKIKKKK